MSARRDYNVFRAVYAFLAVHFIIPSISYITAPEMTLATLDRVNRALGGGALPFETSTGVWHMLAVGNVMTLGFMCGILCVDLRRFYPVLPALAFLKAFSASYSAWIGFTGGPPVFFAIAVLDGVTTVAIVFFAVRGRRALDVLDRARRADVEAPPPGGATARAPLYVRALLPGHRQIERSLERVRAAGIVARTPTTAQIFRGVLRMLHRLVFRTETVGTCRTHAVRRTWRARLLRFRAIRLPFLLAERAVAPLDLSGLASTPERVIRHVLGAHHDGVQVAYDLELLALWPGRLAELRAAAFDVVSNDTPRARWLRDLVVFEGYHENVLAMVDAALRGEALLGDDEARDPDLSLRAYLDWCAAQRDESAPPDHALSGSTQSSAC